MKRTFDEQGYVVARGLFDAGEAAFLRDYFTRLREARAYPGDVVGVDLESNDPLKRYPRMIHMHRWDQVAFEWLLEPRLARALTTLLSGLEPFAVLCTIPADTTQSFTDVTVPLPEGAELVPVIMEPGDVLFFNGSLVHGSEPNRSNRFRRALVGHYIEGDARECALWYHPALRMDGSTVELERGAGGGPCGEWVERDGRPVIELSGYDPRTSERGADGPALVSRAWQSSSGSTTSPSR